MHLPEKEDRWSFAVCLLVVLLGAACVSVFHINDWDIWWHLKTGEHILEEFRVPRADIYSVVASGRRWVNPSWLADVLLYLVYCAGGVNGLIVVKAAMATATAGLIFLCMQRRHGAPAVNCAVSVLALIAAQPRLFVRPLVFTLFFLALLMLLIERHRQGHSRALLAAPIVLMLWANLHAGFVAGLILLGLYAVSERSRHTLIIAALSLAATLINPFFLGVLLYPVRLLSTQFVHGIQEWIAPDFALKFLPFWVMAVGLCVCSLLAASRVRLFDGLVALVFLVLAVRHRRNVADFAVVCAPILASQVSAVAELRRLAKPLQTRYAVAAAAAFSSVLVCLCILFGVHQIGFGVRANTVPRKALDFVAQHSLSGNIFNEYEWGGYIIWRTFPKSKVFMDGRCDVYNDELYREWWGICYGKKGWDEDLRKHDVRLLILDYNRPSRQQGVAVLGDKDVEPFYENTSWKVVYWDSLSMVCVRDVPENREIIERFLCEASNPGTIWKVIGTGQDFEKAFAEIKRKIAEDPTCYVAFDNLGQLLMAKGDLDRAMENYAKCLAINPHFGLAHYHLGVCYYRERQYPRSIESYKRAISCDPNYAPYRHNLADAYLQSDMLLPAERAYRKAIQLDPNFWPSRRNLAVCYERLGRIGCAIDELKAAKERLGASPEIDRKIRDLERERTSR